MGLSNGRLGAGDTQLGDCFLAGDAAQAGEGVGGRVKEAVLFRKITAPMHPAEDTSQTAAAGKAGRDSAVDAGAIEFCVFAGIATADNPLGLICKLQGVEGYKPRH